jgi:hypothetical protein
MSKKICPLEKQVLEHLKEEELSPDLQNHLAECSACQDVAAVYKWMNRFKENAWKIEMAQKDLPAAEAIWDRVYSRKRPDRKLVKKALRPILFAQIFSYGVIATGIIFLTLWGGSKIEKIIDLKPLVQMLPYIFIPATFVVISILFCSLLLALEKLKKPIS